MDTEIRSICDRSRIEHGDYPPLLEQAGHFLGAVGRVVAAAVHGEAILVADEVLEERRDICMGCEFNGERTNGGIRCMKCGCSGLKLELATEACPDDPPRWGRRIKPGDDAN